MSGRGKHRCLEPVFPPLQPLHLPNTPGARIHTCKACNIFTKLCTSIYNATLLGADFSIHYLPSTINCLPSTLHCQYHRHVKKPTARASIVFDVLTTQVNLSHALRNLFSQMIAYNNLTTHTRKVHGQVDAPTYFDGDNS